MNSLPIPCHADIAEADKSQWVCSTPSGLPAGLGGLQAYGKDFWEARKNLAEVVALAVKGGLVEGLDETPDAITLFCTTRKTFELDELDNTAS